MKKIALVTGASRGLGRGFVQVLTKNGYLVYAGARQPLASSHDTDQVKHIQLDVQDDTSIARALARIRHDHGHLDLLINNAGVNRTSAAPDQPAKADALAQLDRATLQLMFDINATSPIMVTQAAVPLMTNPGSFIINISSDRASFATVGAGGNYGYHASKIALNMFTRCLLADLPSNISVFAVHPGWVHTDMSPQGPIEPTDAASRVLGILKSWRPELNGQFLNNDGSLHEL